MATNESTTRLRETLETLHRVIGAAILAAVGVCCVVFELSPVAYAAGVVGLLGAQMMVKQ